MALPPGLAVRIGKASGLVLADPNGEVLGEAPGEAGRGCSISPSRARSSSPQTHGGWPGDLFAYRDLGPLTVKGVVGPVAAAALIAGPSVLGKCSEGHSMPRR